MKAIADTLGVSGSHLACQVAGGPRLRGRYTKWPLPLIRDLMAEAVEARFGPAATPYPVEWLTDNGSCYTANETNEPAHGLRMIPCFTPIRSPEFNGMAEAFVKTFKRDYVYLHDRPNARTFLTELHEWFEDYNEVYPYAGLKMRCPREFIRSRSATASCAVNLGPIRKQPRPFLEYRGVI